jgi:hypothetical protein
VVWSQFAALTLFSTVAAAQQPCTTDATRVVAEVYRHTLERGTDRGAQSWVRPVRDSVCGWGHSIVASHRVRDALRTAVPTT